MLEPFSNRQRKKRMEMFSTYISDCDIEVPRILDLGGQPEIWQHILQPLNITILNLPGITVPVSKSVHYITYIEGDACNVAQYEDFSFDVVFSNSVIEHVGDNEQQKSFANEVHRLAKSYWIQTPSKYFPIEAHCGIPFWWYLPRSFRELMIERWRKKLPKWTEMVEGTTVLTKARIKELFPQATIKSESVFGFVKSYIAYYRS